MLAAVAKGLEAPSTEAAYGKGDVYVTVPVGNMEPRSAIRTPRILQLFFPILLPVELNSSIPRDRNLRPDVRHTFSLRSNSRSYGEIPVCVDEQVRRFDVSTPDWWIPVMQISYASNLQDRVDTDAKNMLARHKGRTHLLSFTAARNIERAVLICHLMPAACLFL